jgi:uncharacterized protein
MATSQTPDIYIKEVTVLPASVVSVATAIPVFIGYTQQAQLHKPGDLHVVPQKVHSLLEYEQYFGLPFSEKGITVFLDAAIPTNIEATATIKKPSPYIMYYALQLFFANGGAACYIVSVGNYSVNSLIRAADLKKGLKAIESAEEVTLVVFPDAIHIKTAAAYYGIHKEAMQLCANRKDKFIILDVWMAANTATDSISALRNYDFGTTDVLRYAAVYYPSLFTLQTYAFDDVAVKIKAKGGSLFNGTLAQLLTTNLTAYQLAKKAIEQLQFVMPAAPAVAGVYAQIDNTRGVWKAPANINIALVASPFKAITDEEQEGLNVNAATGKSINAIRSFTGRGNAIIWGSRTLAGNDNEWRYIPVRRFFIMVEVSVKLTVAAFVFEPNCNATWIKVKLMIEDYLVLLWRSGAIQGVKTQDAFFVHVGLGLTMTAQDISEGRMIVEIGMAAIRPAEFIIVKIVQQMQPQ